MATVTKTIASSGADYATPALAAADFNAGTVAGAVAGDDVVFSITENAAFDSTFLITANPTGYASYTLTVDPSVRHDGTFGSGARLVSSTVQRSILGDAVAALDGTVEWLEVAATGSGKLAAGWDLTAAFDAGHTKTMRGCILRDNGAHATTPFRTVGVGNPSGGTLSTSCNLTLHNTLISNWKSGSTVIAAGVGTAGTGTAQDLLNVTVDGIDVLGGTSGTARGIMTADFANKVVKNCVVTNVGANTTAGTRTCFSGNGGSTVGADNASSDATAFGTGALTSIVRGDNFSAPDSGDFRPLNDSSPIFGVGTDLGTTPTGVNLDLTGRDRDAEGDSWSIGAYQLSAGGAVDPTVAITSPTAYRIYQRSGGSATVTVSGTYAGAGGPTAIEVRVDSGPWATLDAAPAAGVFSGTVSVPEGTRTVSVRWANDTDTAASVSNVLVGDVFLVAGQSNADGRLTNTQTYTHASQKAAVFDPDDAAWRELSDPANRTASGGTPWPLLATQVLADRGVPVGFVTAADGGTSIGQWWTTSAQAKWTAAKGRVTASGVNGLAAVLWDQGETDAIDDVDQATYNARLDGLAGDVQDTYGCPLVCAQVGTTTGIDAGGDLDAIRAAQVEAWGDNAGVEPGPLGYDRAGLHWETDAEGETLAARWWLAVESALYGGSNGRGPRVSSCTLNEARDAVTVVFDRSLKTGLAFDEEPWAVDDDGTPATVSAVAYHGSNPAAVVLTLSAPLSGGAGTCSVTFASGNAAAGRVVAASADVAMPSGSAVRLPAEPFWGQAAAEYVAPGDVEDLAGVPLAAISGFAVTNDSAQ